MSGLEHGGGLDRAMALHGGRREDWLDLSTGINPVPWPVPELSVDSWHRLPDSGAEARLLAAARRAYDVPDSLEIVAAPGTQALIQALPRLLAGDTATILCGEAGTYGEHEHCCETAGRRVRLAVSRSSIPTIVAVRDAVLRSPSSVKPTQRARNSTISSTASTI